MKSLEFPPLYGEEAISILHNFMKELAETENNMLTKRQTTTLKNVAEEMITSVTTEKSKDSQSKATGFVLRFRMPLVAQDQNSGRASEGRRLWRVA